MKKKTTVTSTASLTQYVLVVFDQRHPEVVWFKSNSETAATARAETRSRDTDSAVQLHKQGDDGTDVTVWSSVEIEAPEDEDEEWFEEGDDEEEEDLYKDEDDEEEEDDA